MKPAHYRKAWPGVWFRDVSRPWAPCRLRHAAAALLLVLIACSEPPPDPEALHARAIEHLEQGDHELALSALRSAMGAAPDDPALRLLAARTYLDNGRGDLAEVAVEQALERGADATEAAVVRAAALYAQERYVQVRDITLSAEAPAGDMLRLQLVQARALAAMADGAGMNQTLTLAYLDLFEDASGLSDTPAAREVKGELAEERRRRPEAERAWQHFDCRRSDPVLHEWHPEATGDRRVLRVGASQQYATPAEASAHAGDGDVVLIEPGHYPGGVALWPQNDLLVRGSGARPRITADGRGIERRDVWLFTGNNVTVENVEITGARSPWENGAGIRHMGRGLVLRHVRLADNENGLLTGNRHLDGEILIEFSEFADNGDDEGQAHNVYVGRSGKLTFRYNHSHGATAGHLLKTRARDNVIAYNRLTDGEHGSSSYLVDLPEGGTALVIGNELEQSSATQNHAMVSFAGEALPHAENGLTLVSNSIYNRDFRGIVVRNHGEVAVQLTNNLIGGAPVVLTEGAYEGAGNLTYPDHGMEDPRNLEFSLVSGAAAIDAAVETEVVPELEYVHPLGYRERAVVWRGDVGAHERCGI